MFAGSIKQMDLSQVLKLLTASHQTGVLNLMDSQTGGIVAMIYLQVGQMVHAQVGAVSGLDAISESCRLADETFAFEENVMAPQQTLAAYPTSKLLDKMTDQIAEAKSLRIAMPMEDEIPVYLPGASLAGLDATADDLSLLILCNGVRTVNDLARDSRRSLLETARAVAKFRKAGIVEIKEKTGSGSNPDLSEQKSPHNSGMMTPEAGGSHAAEGSAGTKQARYWRGKLMED